MRLNRFAMLCVVFALESCSKNPDAQSAAPVTVPRITSAETAELQTLGEAALRSAPPGTKLLAVCGPSMGRSYYVATKAAAPSVAGEAWEEDGITNGRIIVLVTPDGKPKALFRGALGELNDAAEGGDVEVDVDEVDVVPAGAVGDYVNAFERLRDPSHLRAWTMEEWRDALKTAGLAVGHEEQIYKTMEFKSWAQRYDDTMKALLRAMLTQVTPAVKAVLEPAQADGDLTFRLCEGLFICKRT